MNKSDVTARWLEAGKRLARDSEAKILCPVCQQATLTVQDVPLEGTNRFERLLRCPQCDAANVLLLNKIQ